jgi:GTPase SAR1 family protein
MGGFTLMETVPMATEISRNDTLKKRFGDYKRWRDALIVVIGNYHVWLQDQGLIDGEDDLRIFELLEALESDKLTVAMVGEFSRGKTELINAIFFADYKQRLLPTEAGRTTMCPTELQYDADQPPGIELLPIETRKSSETIAEYKRSPTSWATVSLELDDPDKMAEAFHEIVRTKDVSIREAQELGLYNPEAPESGTSVKVPVWRHAIINYPHPLLRQGLAVLDTPGLNSLGTEPELTMSMLPNAHVVLFVLDAGTGVTKSDLQVWKEHVCVAKGETNGGRIVVLNKIDTLSDELRHEDTVAASISRQTQETATALGINKNHVVPVSAQQGLIGKIKYDHAMVSKSGLPALERKLSDDIIPAKQALLRKKIVQEIGGIIETTKATINARLVATKAELKELRGMSGKNQDVIQEMVKKVARDQEAYDHKLEHVDSTRQVLIEQVEHLLDYLSMDAFDTLIAKTREDMKGSWTTHGLKAGMKTFFDGATTTMEKVQKQTDPIKGLVQAIYKQFQIEHGLAKIKQESFALQPFINELNRLHKDADVFRNSAIMLITEQHFVIQKFFIALVSRARLLFSECNRAAKQWSKAIMAPVFAQIHEHKSMMDQRFENLKKIHKSLDNLNERITQLEAAQTKLQIQQTMTENVLAKINQPLESSEELPPESAAADRGVA